MARMPFEERGVSKKCVLNETKAFNRQPESIRVNKSQQDWGLTLEKGEVDQQSVEEFHTVTNSYRLQV